MCKHLFLVIRGRRGLYKCEYLFKVRMLSTQYMNAYGTPVKADPPAKVKDWNETILAAETPELIGTIDCFLGHFFKYCFLCYCLFFDGHVSLYT